MAEAAATPEVHFAVGCGAATARAKSHAMHIGTAGVTSPDSRFLSVCPGLKAVMLLNAQIAYGMTCLPQCAQQLWLGVLQGLSPLRMLGAHRQDSAFER